MRVCPGLRRKTESNGGTPRLALCPQANDAHLPVARWQDRCRAAEHPPMKCAGIYMTVGERSENVPAAGRKDPAEASRIVAWTDMQLYLGARAMMLRALLTTLTLVLMTLAATADTAAGSAPQQVYLTGMGNVRAYAAAPRSGGRAYAVDGGRLFGGMNGSWRPIDVPGDLVINAVAVDRKNEDTVFVGAANKLSVFVSRDAGRRWTEVPLMSEAVAGVTTLAFDAANRLLYAGTDSVGLFRLLDLGEAQGGLVAGGHLLLDELVEEAVTDSTGEGLAFVRTAEKLYRAEEAGLRWLTVESLPGRVTSIAVADTSPPQVFAGTEGAGLFVSRIGVAWRPVGPAGNGEAESGLSVRDLSIDPAQPNVLYLGGTDAQVVVGGPERVWMSRNGGASWETIAELERFAVAELLPVSGKTGTVFALTTGSRRPQSLHGEAADNLPMSTSDPAAGADRTGPLAWILAGHAGAALIVVALTGKRKKSRRRAEPELALDAARTGRGRIQGMDTHRGAEREQPQGFSVAGERRRPGQGL